jgi:ELWxxDGT repeat protein
VTGFAVLGQQAYFFADDGVHGRELWASDGSKFGTRMVHELKPGWDSWYPSYLTAGGGKLFFLARETANSSTELYSFDPATRSTLRLSNVPANGLTFIHGRLKGTAQGAVLLRRHRQPGDAAVVLRWHAGRHDSRARHRPRIERLLLARIELRGGG